VWRAAKWFSCVPGTGRSPAGGASRSHLVPEEEQKTVDGAGSSTRADDASLRVWRIAASAELLVYVYVSVESLL